MLPQKGKEYKMKKIGKALLILVIVVVLAAGAGLGYLSWAEYRPAAVEELTISPDAAGKTLPLNRRIDVLTWNIGYGALGAASDFFMDGGKSVRAADQFTVSQYMGGIRSTLYNGEDTPALILLQEVDLDSTRSFGMDERSYLAGDDGVTALNFAVEFVPYPLPPLGKVHSGLFTTTQGYDIARAQRIALPCPFSWPVRTVNLKRCLLASWLPVEGTDKQLCLVNLHLEAYDDGEGKIAQTRQLRDFIESEYKKGNYVIAGGDFNQVFPGTLEVYPNTHPELWSVGSLSEELLPEGFQYGFDSAAPTCRLLNQPYDPADTVNTQYYVIDGFIVSPNVRIDRVQTVDAGFENSDHNPVRLSVTLVG